MTKRFHLSEDSPKLIRRPTLSWEHVRAFKSLDFNDDSFKNDKVWLVVRVQLPPLVVDRYLGLGHEGDAPEFELDLESVLIHSFKKPWAKDAVHFHCCANDRVCPLVRAYASS